MPSTLSRVTSFLTALYVWGSLGLVQARSQTIAPASDGTGTIVNAEGDLFNITGGQLSGDGANLFHSFQQFGLEQNQTANFISNPNIQNILGRVVGGNPSVINGLIQVIGGNSNLFLVNPAGIIFGNNASLNVPADFTATTANSIGFGANSFNAIGINNYGDLIGTPSAFIFNSSQPGVIVNTGQLAVGQGQNLNLLGGTVVNTGTISAPAGNITIAAVPGSSLLRISQPGHLLSLEIQSTQSAIANALTLPQLLTGGNISSATGITANADGTVQLGSSSIAVNNGDVVIASPSSHLAAKTAIISANHNLTLVESQLQTTGDLNLLANNTVQIRDSLANPFLAKANGNLTIQGNLGIDILALNHPQTPFQSGGDMSLISDGLISTDAHFDAGGNFEIRTLAGIIANFSSLYDPIINVGSNYSVGNYTGASLQVTAGGNITYGNVIINAIDPTVHPTNPAFFLTAGGTITGTGNISTLAATGGLLVNFQAVGDIFTGGISTQGGTITLNSSGGTINTNGSVLSTINGASAGANITLTASGNITTNTLSTYSQNTIGNSNNGGAIAVTSNTGSISTGALDSSSQTSSGNTATGGNITLSAINGNVTTNNITARSAVSSSGSSGNSGTISITALGNINTASLSAKSETQAGGSTSNGAAINLNGDSINVIGSVESNSYSGSFGSAGNGGAINLTATNGINITSYVQSSSYALVSGGSSGNGAAINISGSNIQIGSYLSAESNSSNVSSGSGGNINLTATNGNISTGGSVSSISKGGTGIASTGGAITINSNNGVISIGGIKSYSNLFGASGNTSNSGNIFVSATNGILVSGNIEATSYATTNASNGGIVTLGTANGNITITGSVNTYSIGSTGISANGGTINITASNGNISTGNLESYTSTTSGPITNAGAIALTGKNITVTNIDAYGAVGSGNIKITADEINFTGTSVKGRDTITFKPLTLGQDINLGGSDSGISTTVDLTATKLGILQNISAINIGRADGTGTITLSPFTFTVPVTIDGGSTLVGANQNTTWTLTGSNSGSLSGFGNPLTFNSIENIQGGNSTDTFAVNNGVNFNGTVSGGSGSDTLNYSASTTAITADLQTIIALGIENIIASSATTDTLIGYNTANTFNITGSNSGNLNGILNFSGFENLSGGAGNDTFAFSGTGNINGTINAGAGIDILNYSAYASAITLNLQSLTALGIESVIGSNFNDTLIATNTNNTFNITGNNSGSFNTLSFSSFENITGGTLNDNFVFSGTGNISGNINGSSGINSLDYSSYSNSVSVNLANSTATGTGSFSNISNFSGSTNNDTITGANTANTWTLTGTNSVTVGTLNFSGFENLVGGTANDTFTISNFTGNATLDGAGGSDIYNVNLQGTGVSNLTISDSGSSGSDTLTIFGTTNADIFNLTTTQIQLGSEKVNYNTGVENLAIDAGLSNDQININAGINLSGNLSLTTGSDGSNITSNATINAGSVDITGSDIILNNAVNTNGGRINITSNNGSIVAKNTLNSSSSIGNGGAIALSATGNITTADIDSHSDNSSGGNINLTTQTGSINTGNLTSNGLSAGGAISVIAIDSINLGQINTSATIGNAGNVFIDPLNDVQVEWINAQGGTIGTGGIVDITTQRYFRSTGTFSDRNGILASISTSGGAGSGDVTIRHYGGYVGVPFEVGNSSINGTAGAITSSASNIIAAYQSFPGSYTQGNIKIITKNPIPTTTPITPITPSLVIPAVQTVVSPVLAENLEPSIEPHYLTPPNLSKQLTLSGEQLPLELDSRVSEIEKSFSGQFAEYLGQSTNNSLKTLAEASEILNKIEKSTGIKPALIYVSFLPQAVATENGQSKTNNNDQLEILVVTSKGKPIRRVVYGTKRAQVLKVANEFRNTVSNIKRPLAYLASAQQMYKWLIAPIKVDLQHQGIQNLVFIMDKGLRSIPIAALHNGQSFLIEDYSAGIMPSLSLSDTRYADIKNSQVLGMGAAKFTNQTPLPSVPIELSVVTKQLRNGKSFLNEGFTLKNLKGERQQQPFQIIHLATHGEFKPGPITNSYIQLWDTQLRLDQLRQLGWSNPPVELLVLSACRTALGDEDAELGFAGLAVLAGVKSAMGSLWYVSDEGTLGLMTEFYEQLKTAPIKSEALRRAQLAMLRGEISLEQGKLRTKANDVLLPSELANLGSIKLTHPYYWAAFTVVGNPW